MFCDIVTLLRNSTTEVIKEMQIIMKLFSTPWIGNIYKRLTTHSVDEAWTMPTLTADGASVSCIAVGDGKLIISVKILPGIKFDPDDHF